jgi:hypothetical protein
MKRPSWTVPLEVRQQQLFQYDEEMKEVLRDLKPLKERRYLDLSWDEALLLSDLEDELQDLKFKIKNVKKRIREWNGNSTYWNRTHSNRASGQCSQVAQQGV